jgi:hypothetical protein
MNSLNKIINGNMRASSDATPVFKKLLTSVAVLGALAMAGHANMAQAATQNNLTGEVERITVLDPNDRWSRGTMVVAGQTVIIPRNFVIDLPANRQTIQELFANRPSACPPDQTGLAKADSCNHSFTGAIATILANKTNNGNVIAGEVMLEKATEIVSGIVSYIDYNDGYFRVDGIPGDPDTGAMVRINDPEGRFTHQQGAGCLVGSGPNCSADVRYGVDPDNYTVTASTGYPMCIPSTVARSYDLDVNRNGVIEAGETGLVAQDDGTGSSDELCPATNRGVDPVGDSRLFAPFQLGDHVTADGNFETIDGVTFLSAHTVGLGTGLTTADDPFQPDYMIFDEVGWDVPGFQNQRVRDLLIAFGSLGTTDIDVFGLYYDPTANEVNKLVFATTYGCELSGGAGTCSNVALVGNTAVFKIVHDVDFLAGTDAKRGPCAHLQAAYAGDGIPVYDNDLNVVRNPPVPPATVGTPVFLDADPKGRCPTPFAGTGVLTEEFEVLSPPTRDIIGISRHKAALDPSTVTLDFHGTPSQNGAYLNPTGIGHPEFVEINLAALQTPLIFAGEPWNMDRRLGPGGGCDGEPECDTTTPIGDPSMSLDPFPFSDLDPGTQNNAAAVPTPIVSGYTTQRGRPLSYWPLSNHETPVVPNAQVLPWPPTDPAAEPILPTQHADLVCSILSGLDTDGDTIDDAIDNCTLVPNTDQRNTDGDLYGNICDADLNNDGTVNLSDYSAFRSAFGTSDPDADFTGDGQVNLSDYSIFRRSFGKAPGPAGVVP